MSSKKKTLLSIALSIFISFLFLYLVLKIFQRKELYVFFKDKLLVFLEFNLILVINSLLFINFNIIFEKSNNNGQNSKYLFKILFSFSSLFISLGYIYYRYNQFDLFTILFYSDFTKYLFFSIFISLLISTNIKNLCKQVFEMIVFIKNNLKLSYTYLFLVSPIAGLVIIEVLNLSTLESVNLDFIFINLLLYEIIHVFFYVLFRKIKITSTISLMIIYFIGIANYFVIDFKGIPIIFSDLLSITTAFSVSGAYEFKLNSQFYLSMFIFVLLIMLMMIIPEKKQESENNEVIESIIVFFLLMIINNFVYSSGLYFQDTSHGHWDPSMKFEKYGYLASFMYDFNKSLKVDIENYSVEEVDKILADYENLEEASSRKPNIIVVMNEAFSDLSILGNFKTNEDYLSYFNSLQSNTIKGILSTSPVRGSGTGFTEFEFLTGNSMAFLRGTNPYVQYINSDMPSIVSTLKDQNYQALAMHPYKKTSYNRVSVYSHFGFEDYITMENFDNPETVRGNISDLENYKKLIELYENRDKEKSFFIFNITMQNHGGYVDTGYKFNNPIEVTSFEVQKDVDVFLSLMKESDLAFKYLIDYFSEVKEDTIILMFGDHQPMLDNDFLEKVYRKPISEFTLEDKSKLYQVPFIIWTNYDIQECYIDNISINYLSTLLLETAGLKKTTYHTYLSSLRGKLPVVVANFYGNPEGEFFSYETDTEYNNYLEEYEKIQYNFLFDTKNRLDKYFYLN